MSAEQLTDEVVKKGHILKVWNTKRPKFSNENKKYFVIHVKENGEEFPIMLTNNELTIAIRRAARNPEDVPTKGFITDLLD